MHRARRRHADLQLLASWSTISTCGITHVIRGDDHVNNTPRQINLIRCAGRATLPVYAHLPTVLGDDGHKLSKRHGAVSVMEY